jgi:hypothetical protein
MRSPWKTLEPGRRRALFAIQRERFAVVNELRANACDCVVMQAQRPGDEHIRATPLRMVFIAEQEHACVRDLFRRRASVTNDLFKTFALLSSKTDLAFTDMSLSANTIHGRLRENYPRVDHRTISPKHINLE